MEQAKQQRYRTENRWVNTTSIPYRNQFLISCRMSRNYLYKESESTSPRCMLTFVNQSIGRIVGHMQVKESRSQNTALHKHREEIIECIYAK